MALLYKELIRQVGNRLNAISGDTPAGVETSYTASSFTVTQLDNPAFTPTILTDAILSAQETLIKAICETANHPWRGLYAANTVPLTNGQIVPVVDSTGKQILGSYGTIKDAASSVSVTEIESTDVIRRIIRGIAAGYIVNPIYLCSFSDERIFHTRASVLIDVCSFDHAAEITAIQTPSNPAKIPEALNSALVSGAVAIVATNESPALAAMASAHSQFFGASIAMIQRGLTSADKTPE